MQHQTAARTGPSLSTLPSMVEMEDMLSKNRAHRIRMLVQYKSTVRHLFCVVMMVGMGG